jgi:putative nucleotidyltransferase with HDIG domain
MTTKKFDDVGKFLDMVTDLPVLPANIQRITDLIEAENSSADDISAVIATEQALSSRVLKIANSVFYGRINQVVNINESVVVIGLANIKSMLYAIFMDQLYGTSGKSDNMLTELWKHSLTTAMMSQKIMEQINPSEKDTAYMAGLLHDIGELIMFKYEPELFKEIIFELKKSGDLSRTAVEESIIGFSHADLGAAMARKWNLPRAIRNAIFFHHSPGNSDNEVDKFVIAAVNTADSFCAAAKIGGTDILAKNDNIKDILSKESVSILKLDQEKIKLFTEQMNEIKNSAEEHMDALKNGKQNVNC